MPDYADAPPPPRPLGAYPQAFVADVGASAAHYVERLGFEIVYLYGEPPFYGLVRRGAAHINLRCVAEPVFAGDVRERESLLMANIPVDGVDAMFAELASRGADIARPLRQQPWGAHDFIVRDPDGNLLCFASAA